MNKKFVVVVNIAMIFVLSLVASVPVGGARCRTLNFTILHWNDEHANVLPASPTIDYTYAVGDDLTTGGMARFATQVYRTKIAKMLQREPVLMLQSGDFLMKTMFDLSYAAGFTPELTFMQWMGMDALTFGNHEFDFSGYYQDSSEHLANYLKAAGYPDGSMAQRTSIVISNLIIPPGDPLEDVGIERYIIKKLPKGVKVGIFGILGAIGSCVFPEDRFLDPIETAAEMVDVLTDLDVDMIVCLSHSGNWFDMGMASAVPGIDVIISGHDHRALFEPIIVDETIIVEAGSNYRYLGQLELSITLPEGEVSIRNYDTGEPFLLGPIDDSIPANPLWSLIIDKVYVKAINEMLPSLTNGICDDILDVVAEAEFDIACEGGMCETSMGDLLTDSMRAAVDGDFATESGGMQVLSTIKRGTMPGVEDMITMYELYRPASCFVEPLGNPLINFYCYPEELKRFCELSVTLSAWMGSDYYLQFSGIRYTYNPALIGTFDAVVKLEQEIDGTYTLMYDHGDWYVPEDTLYECAGDLLEITYLPGLGAMIPPLKIVIKDEYGNPIADPVDAIVYQAPGVQLKTWQAMLFYVDDFPDTDFDGIPNVPLCYSAPQGLALIGT